MKTLRFEASQNKVRHWWLMLPGAVLLSGIGIWIIFSPFQSYLVLSVALAIVMIGAGAFEIMFLLINHRSMSGWAWALAAGLVDVAIGGYLLYYPLITMVILSIAIGGWMLFRGIVAIGHSMDIQRYGFFDWTWLVITGALNILLALIILSGLFLGILSIITWTGLAFILSGVTRFYHALKVRSGK